LRIALIFESFIRNESEASNPYDCRALRQQDPAFALQIRSHFESVGIDAMGRVFSGGPVFCGPSILRIAVQNTYAVALSIVVVMKV
jgi:hypothetical protein